MNTRRPEKKARNNNTGSSVGDQNLHSSIPLHAPTQYHRVHYIARVKLYREEHDDNLEQYANGHLEVLQRAHEQGCPLDSSLSSSVRDENVQKWLNEKGITHRPFTCVCMDLF